MDEDALNHLEDGAHITVGQVRVGAKHQAAVRICPSIAVCTARAAKPRASAKRGARSVTKDEDRMAKYRTLLSIPQTIMPFAFVCLGWPEKPGWRENRFKPERIKQETWS